MNRARDGHLAGLVRGLVAALVVAAGTAADASSQEPARAWRLDLGKLRGAALASVFDVGGKLLVEDEEQGLTALDPATGRVLWFLQMREPLAFPPRATAQAIVLTGPVDIVIVDPADGARLDQVGNPNHPSGAAVADAAVLYMVQEYQGRLIAWSRRDGREAWHFDVPGGVVGSPLLTGGGDATRVVVVGGDGVMRSIRGGLQTPEGESWTARVGALASTPLQLGDRIVTAGRDGRVTSRRAASGGVTWQRVLGEPAVASLVHADDLVLVALAHRTLALDATTGETRWSTDHATRPLGSVGEGGEVLMRGAGDRPRLWTGDRGVPSLSLPYGTLVIAGQLVQLERTTFTGLRLP